MRMVKLRILAVRLPVELTSRVLIAILQNSKRYDARSDLRRMKASQSTRWKARSKDG